MKKINTTRLIKQLYDNAYKIYETYLSLFFIEQNANGNYNGITKYNNLLIKLRGFIQNEHILLFYLSEKKDEVSKLLDNLDENNLTETTFYELLDNDKEILIKRRIAKQLWEMVNHPGYKLISEQYLSLSNKRNVIYLINYAFANLLINNAKRSYGNIATFLTRCKYLFAFLNPIIEKEMLNCRFGKENYGVTMDYQLQECYSELIINQTTDYVRAFRDLNKDNDKHIYIILAYAIQSIITYLTPEQKTNLRDSILNSLFTKDYCENNFDAIEKIDYIKAIFDGNNLLEELKKDLQL